jgi:hypothetical protein
MIFNFIFRQIAAFSFGFFMKQLNHLLRLSSFFLVSAIAAAAGIASDDVSGKVTIHGSIVDQNHAVVAGAAVTAVPVGRTDGLATSSNGYGEFYLTLEAGEYDLKVTAEGFAGFIKRITVKPSESSELAIELSVAGNTAVVTITASGEYQSEMTAGATKTLTPLRDIPQSISVTPKAAD